MNWIIEQVGLQSDIVIALPVLGVLALGLVGVVFAAGVITYIWGKL